MNARDSGAIEVVEEPHNTLAQYAKTPVVFTVESPFDVHERSDEGFRLVERQIDLPYVKDYDAIESQPSGLRDSI